MYGLKCEDIFSSGQRTIIIENSTLVWFENYSDNYNFKKFESLKISLRI